MWFLVLCGCRTVPHPQTPEVEICVSPEGSPSNQCWRNVSMYFVLETKLISLIKKKRGGLQKACNLSIDITHLCLPTWRGMMPSYLHKYLQFMEKHRCLCCSLLSISKNYINLPYAESGLPLMLLAEGSPCPYLNPRAFFIVFSSPVPLRTGRERAV